MTRLVLASASPRRRQLLVQLGLQPEVIAADIDETVRPAESDQDYVKRMAREKAVAIATIVPEAVVLAADTAISLDGRVIGKPKDEKHAMAIWQSLSGRIHHVYSAVAVCCGSDCNVALSRSEVHFADLPETAVLSRYWASGEPQDKAGAYAIQGMAAQWVACINGSYSGIMGLPLHETAQLLKKAGVEIMP